MARESIDPEGDRAVEAGRRLQAEAAAITEQAVETANALRDRADRLHNAASKFFLSIISSKEDTIGLLQHLEYILEMENEYLPKGSIEKLYKLARDYQEKLADYVEAGGDYKAVEDILTTD